MLDTITKLTVALYFGGKVVGNLSLWVYIIAKGHIYSINSLLEIITSLLK